MSRVLFVVLAVSSAAFAGLVLPTVPTTPPLTVYASVNNSVVNAHANLTWENNQLDYDIGEWVYLSEFGIPVNQSMQAIGVFGQNSWAVMNGSLSIPGCYSAWQVEGALGLLRNNAGGSIINCLFGNQTLFVLLDKTTNPIAYYIDE